MKVIEFVTMKNHLPICSFVAISLLFNINAFASHPIRVACIGDSITYGAGIEDPAKDGYPAVLQRMLGSGFEVRNYGLNARVMTQEGDNPYMKETEYAQVKAFLPDIVTIMLGTNDSKPHNWNAGLYEGSYQQMINELKAMPSHPDIYVCLPPPAYEDKWGVNDSARKTSQSFDFASWEATLRNIIERTAAFDKDCRLVLCTPFIEKRGAVGRSDSFDDRHAIVERLASIVRKVADEYGLVCVDYAALMDSLLDTDRSGDRNYWTWDGIHPTYAAHHKMSELWIRTAGRKLLKH